MAAHITSPPTIMEWIAWLEILSAIPQSRFEEAIIHTVKEILKDDEKGRFRLNCIIIFKRKIKKRKDATKSKRLL